MIGGKRVAKDDVRLEAYGNVDELNSWVGLLVSELSDGFIASDIAYVVNDAAMIAAFTDQPITQALLEETIRNTHPSLRKDTLKVFDEIRQKMEGVERSNLNERPKIGFRK